MTKRERQAAEYAREMQKPMNTADEHDPRRKSIKTIERFAGVPTCGDPEAEALEQIERTEPTNIAEAKPEYMPHFEGRSPEQAPEPRLPDVVPAEDEIDVDDEKADPSGSYHV